MASAAQLLLVVRTAVRVEAAVVRRWVTGSRGRLRRWWGCGAGLWSTSARGA